MHFEHRLALTQIFARDNAIVCNNNIRPKWNWFYWQCAWNANEHLMKAIQCVSIYRNYVIVFGRHSVRVSMWAEICSRFPVMMMMMMMIGTERAIAQSNTEKINFHRFDMLILRHTSYHCSGLTFVILHLHQFQYDNNKNNISVLFLSLLALWATCVFLCLCECSCSSQSRHAMPCSSWNTHKLVNCHQFMFTHNLVENESKKKKKNGK